jgi:lysophospholipid acyltransferase (LPLAT)-like uncharacterized protein
MLKTLLRHTAVQSLFAHVVGLYLSFALHTTRWTLDGAENLEPHALGAPAILVAWHERLALMPMQWLLMRRRARRAGLAARVHILISHSRDGRFIAAVVRRFGIDVAPGSSSRGGTVAVRNLLALLEAGSHIGMTPDGPRGPRRRAAQGIAQIAALSGAPILPCAAQTSRRWVLKTWDRMVIPRPFGRAVIVCGPPIHVARANWRGALPEIEAALTAAADRADALCDSGFAKGSLPEAVRSRGFR